MKKTPITIAFMVFLSVFVATIVVPPEVRATTLYVGGGGPGNYTTIQGAIDDAVQGDTVFVYQQTYNENLVIDKSLTLFGEDRDSTWINGGGSGDTIHVTADWVNVTGFFVLNGGMNPLDAGIELDDVTRCNVSGNNFTVNDSEGVVLQTSRNNTIAGNNILYNGNVGIYLLSSHNNTITGNNVSSNGFDIFVESSNGNVFAYNSASDSDTGIALFYSDDNTFTGNNASDNTLRGINVENSDNNTLENNTVRYNTRDGIRILLSNNSELSGNNISNSQIGILLSEADGMSIANNTVSANGKGINLYHSRNGTFVGNVMTSNGFFPEGNIVEWSSHDVDTSNTVNGRPVRYWRNAFGGIVPQNAGQVILANCTWVTVEDQIVNDATVGIAIGHSANSVIRRNTVSSNVWEGILIESSGSLTISQNTVVENFRGMAILFFGNSTITDNVFLMNADGVRLYSSDGNIIDNNTILEGARGFNVQVSDDNIFTNNSVISNNWAGIELAMSNGNSIILNSIRNCSAGIRAWGSLDNTIHHNDFLYNADSANDTSADNQWDDGYPSGGNYWSDYTGIDFFSGPDQNQAGSDGIGDTPYDQIGGAEDKYPLMSPMTSLAPRPPRNLRAELTGNDFENVTVAWNRSLDDGAGANDVVRYDIYISTSYGGPYVSLFGAPADGSDGYEWTCAGCGEGDPSNYFFYIEANDSLLSTPTEDKCAKFTRPLGQGANLISIPLLQTDESIETVLQTVEYDKAWSYDSSSGAWNWYMTGKGYRRGLWAMNHTTGVWVNASEDSNLTVAGTVPAQTTIQLHEGWNLVSFPSFSSYTIADLKAEIGASRVEGFDPTPPHFLRVLGDGEVLQTGYGYWVRVSSDTDWIVEA